MNKKFLIVSLILISVLFFGCTQGGTTVDKNTLTNLTPSNGNDNGGTNPITSDPSTTNACNYITLEDVKATINSNAINFIPKSAPVSPSCTFEYLAGKVGEMDVKASVGLVINIENADQATIDGMYASTLGMGGTEFDGTGYKAIVTTQKIMSGGNVMIWFFKGSTVGTIMLVDSLNATNVTSPKAIELAKLVIPKVP